MNKKVFIVTIISIVALIASIVFVSYAAYTANITGTKTQTLGNNGYATMSCSETNFSATGVAVGTKKSYICDLDYVLNGSMTVEYDVSMIDISCGTGATCMAEVTRSIDGGSASIIMSSTNVSSFNSLNIATGILTSSTKIKFTINGWISALPSNSSSSNTTGKCSNSSYTTQSACESANEIWGTSQTQTQDAKTFSFKVKFDAYQTQISDDK